MADWDEAFEQQFRDAAGSYAAPVRPFAEFAFAVKSVFVEAGFTNHEAFLWSLEFGRPAIKARFLANE